MTSGNKVDDSASKNGDECNEQNGKSKRRLMFSIDSLVGDDAGTKNDKDHPRKSPSSPTLPAKRRFSQTQQQIGKEILFKTPPATANSSTFPAGQSAFFSPASVSDASASTLAHNSWNFAAQTDPANTALWKDAVAASAAFYNQAAVAAALYGYQWPPAPGVQQKQQELQLLGHVMQQQQQQQQYISPVHSHHHAMQQQHQGKTSTSNLPGAFADQEQTFWQQHIAELLRQNGGHQPRFYAAGENNAAAAAAAGFLFSNCRKPKRIRTAFSPNQLMELEGAFDRNQYVVGNERKELARRLVLTETQVKVWFQNRRTKQKRMKNEEHVSTPGTSASASSGGSKPAEHPESDKQSCPGKIDNFDSKSIDRFEKTEKIEEYSDEDVSIEDEEEHF